MKQKILSLSKEKSFIILLIVEFLLLVYGVVGLFGKNAVYGYGVDQGSLNFGEFQETRNEYYADETMGMSGNMVDFDNIKLRPGRYLVSLCYQTDTNMMNYCSVSDASLTDKNLLVNGEHLYAGRNHTEYEMWLFQDTESLTVHVEFGGTGSLSVAGVTITETNGFNRMFLFVMVVFSLLADVLLLSLKYDRIYGIPVKSKKVALGLGGVILAAAVPLMVDYMPGSSDLIFHLHRIEGIKDGILGGQFPVRIASEWQQGYGYAASVFYGDTLLYLAAFFRLLGFSVLTSYQMFYFVITAATALITYYCFTKIFNEQYIGLVCSALYTLSVYRIYKMYVRGYMGETMAFLFLPILVYGFHRVLSMDVEKKAYKKSWIPLTVGFTGLIQSHLLTCEMVGGFTVLLCIIFWKKVLCKKTFVCLVKTVVYSGLLSAWFLVPFADYMINGDYVIQNVQARTIQEMGLQLAQLFTVFPQNGNNLFFSDNGMVDGQPVSLGIGLIFVLVAWLGLVFVGKSRELHKSYRVLGNVATGFALLAMWMSLSSFPWNAIQSQNRFTAFLVSSLQYPNRFLSIATIALVAVAGIVTKWVLDHGRENYRMGYFVVLALLVLCSSGHLVDDVLNTANPVKVYNYEGMGTGYISGGEYNPYGSNPALFMPFVPEREGLEVAEFEKRGLKIEFLCKNLSERDAVVELPLLYYKGYAAYAENGDILELCTGDNFEVAVRVPANYEGEVRVEFQSPWYWRGAELISLMMAAVLMIQKCLLPPTKTSSKKNRAKKSSEKVLDISQTL